MVGGALCPSWYFTWAVSEIVEWAIDVVGVDIDISSELVKKDNSEEVILLVDAGDTARDCMRELGRKDEWALD
jgi:hypothetical protein